MENYSPLAPITYTQTGALTPRQRRKGIGLRHEKVVSLFPTTYYTYSFFFFILIYIFPNYTAI